MREGTAKEGLGKDIEFTCGCIILGASGTSRRCPRGAWKIQPEDTDVGVLGPERRRRIYMRKAVWWDGTLACRCLWDKWRRTQPWE